MFFILKSFKIDILSLYQNKTKSVKKQVIFLVIPNAKERNYLALRKLSAVLREITSKHDGDFCCLNFLHSFKTIKNKLESYKNCVKRKIFGILLCLLNTLRYQSFINIRNLIKIPFVIYADLQFLIEKFNGCKNNSEKSSTTKVSEHISSGLSISTI